MVIYYSAVELTMRCSIPCITFSIFVNIVDCTCNWVCRLFGRVSCFDATCNSLPIFKLVSKFQRQTRGTINSDQADRCDTATYTVQTVVIVVVIIVIRLRHEISQRAAKVRRTSNCLFILPVTSVFFILHLVGDMATRAGFTLALCMVTCRLNSSGRYSYACRCLKWWPSLSSY